MITSIVLTGMYNIGISDSGKIQTPDGVIINTKDIPFVRYRFSEYNSEQLEFIKKNKARFNCVHVAEVTLSPKAASELKAIREMDENIACLVYIDVTDTEVANGLTDEQIELIESVEDCEIDRLLIRDKSNSMYEMALDKLKKQVSDASDFDVTDIGCCGGPCAFFGGNACLTALHAREILARYADRDDIVVPSANHEGTLDKADTASSCVNKCGCIRYHIFSSDMTAPISKSGGTKKSTGVKKEKSDNTPKKPKQPKIAGYTEADFW